MELLKIRTEQFEGPLDLLLFLIQKNEMDISSINIHAITDQYVQYIEMMKELNFDVASEFLVMAATLIHLKSKRLLPGEETASTASSTEEIQSEEELIRRLIEYKKYQEAAKQLNTLPQVGRDIFPRPGVLPPEKQTIWKELDITELTLAFQDVLRRSRMRSKVIIRESISLQERITQLASILKVGEMTEFIHILPTDPEKADVIVTFVALLELARLKKLRIYQNTTFGTIYLTLEDDLNTLDASMITGFKYKAGEQIQHG